MTEVLALFEIDWSEQIPLLTAGLRRTLMFTGAGFIGATTLGLVIAMLRVSTVRPLRWIAAVYTETFKNIPLMAIIFLVYVGLATGVGIRFSAFQGGVIALTLFYAAYLSEIFRSAILGVHGGQKEASEALGLGRFSTFRKVIFPQALRMALPGTNTMFVDLLKSTSLLVVIAAAELMTAGSLIRSRTFRALEVYVVIAAIYFAMCYPLSQALLWLERQITAGNPLSPGRRRRLKAVRVLLKAEKTELDKKGALA
ncbi:MAG TPA: amino acid ABC transporter permease [Euzebya sp.]|nr:amino acid ABC transporter permease [Euzebya sp.]